MSPIGRLATAASVAFSFLIAGCASSPAKTTSFSHRSPYTALSRTSRTIGSSPSTVPSTASCSQSPGSTPTMAYVTYHLIGSQFHYYVAAIDLPAARIRWTVEVPDALAVDSLAVAPDGETVYAIVGGNDTNGAYNPAPVELMPINSSSGKIGAPLRLPGPMPFQQGFAISPDGRYALVAQSGAIDNLPGLIGKAVSLVNLARRSVKTIHVGPAPSGVAFSWDSSQGYVTTRRGLRILDLAKAAVTATVAMPQDGDLVVTHQGLGIVAWQGGDLLKTPSTIGLVNLNSVQPQRAVSLPYTAGGYIAPVAVTCDGTTAYVLTEGQNAAFNLVNIVDRIDLTTYQVTPLSQVPGFGGAIAESPNHDTVWATRTAASCGLTGCPNEFISLDSHGAADRGPVVTLPMPIELLAMGPYTGARIP